MSSAKTVPTPCNRLLLSWPSLLPSASALGHYSDDLESHFARSHHLQSGRHFAVCLFAHTEIITSTHRLPPSARPPGPHQWAGIVVLCVCELVRAECEFPGVCAGHTAHHPVPQVRTQLLQHLGQDMACRVIRQGWSSLWFSGSVGAAGTHGTALPPVVVACLSLGSPLHLHDMRQSKTCL